MDLNKLLNQLNNEEFNQLMNDVFSSLSTEIGDFSLSQQDRTSIIQIARICTYFGVINNPKASPPIDKEKNNYKRLVLYTARWLKKLVSNRSKPISLKKAPPLRERDTVRDPALAHVLNHYYIENSIPITDQEIQVAIDNHDLLMSIENIQGHLLEEYIAHNICKKPFNFIWLDGEIVKAADFSLLKQKSKDKVELYLLQIKNKYNTENSSSVTVRDGTKIKISKWYRLGKRKHQGINVPDYKWEDLNKIIKDECGTSPNLSENQYIKFLTSVMEINPKLINI